MHPAKVRTAYGRSLVTRGDLSGGVDQLRQGFLLDERNRNRRGLSIVTPLLVNVLVRQGQNQQASELLDRALAIAPNERAIQRLREVEQGPAPSAAPRLTGKIKRLLESMGRPRYGFIETDRGETDVYFSEKQIGIVVYSSLSVGMSVEADVVTGADGRRQALAVRPGVAARKLLR
jgi:cold shock CspA family protein